MQEIQIQPLGQEDPLKKEMVNHSSILAWRIPWTEDPDTAVHGVTKEPDITTKRQSAYTTVPLHLPHFIPMQ